MRPSVVLIIVSAAPVLAGCAGFGGEPAPAKLAAAAAPPPPPAAQPMAPVAAVQAQPLPPAAAVSAAPTPPPPGALQPSPPTPSVVAPGQSPAQPMPSGPALGGVLGGPIGALLTDVDRQAAWNAQIAALDSGQKRSWRGAHGVFGFVAPGAETGGGCRAYSQTIYVAGRPNRGQGVACRQADGSWKVTS